MLVANSIHLFHSKKYSCFYQCLKYSSRVGCNLRGNYLAATSPRILCLALTTSCFLYLLNHILFFRVAFGPFFMLSLVCCCLVSHIQWMLGFCCESACIA
ncbi:hypothetical protein CICLE_v10030433mg [Citrus x clementina]|uniref:Uncharacterized protein n=1 Tax=Citrus clementina TaxID=85681 RepID=V4SD13_CITCL|nr:hypothetical protein CICLE_v10030433mg [Citrus x clementina]